MLKKKPGPKNARHNRNGRPREISPLLLYLIGTTLLSVLLLLVLLVFIGPTLKVLLIAVGIGFVLPWFGYFAWRFSKIVNPNLTDIAMGNVFLRFVGMTTYVVLISIFWAIAQSLGYQCNIEINDGSDN